MYHAVGRFRSRNGFDVRQHMMAESKLEIETSSEDVYKYSYACKVDGETNNAVVPM